ncbi:hypothetical protein [Methylobacterium indicum]|nr:hypothetical protein [Methylobacterium indicum]
MAYASLTADEQKHFLSRIAVYGLSPDDLKGKTVVTGQDKPGPLVISAAADLSDVPVIQHEIKDVAQMKALGGIPDEHYTQHGIADHHVEYPPAIDHDPQHALTAAKGDMCALLEHLGPERSGHVGSALRAYLLGNSSKVQDYEPLINTMHFPVTGGVVALDSITVTPGNPLKITGPGPVSMNVAVMTVEPGAQVIVETELTLNIGQLYANVTK